MTIIYQPPTPLSASKAVIETYCEQVSCQFKLTHFGADNDPLFDFTEKLGGTIHYVEPDHMMESEDGSIVVHEQNRFDVYISKFTGPMRDRFTLAHELGHYFLHSSQGKIPLKASRGGRSPAEWEANWFAAALLLPKTEIISFWDERSNRGAIRVAGRFHVSQQAAEYRINALGLKP